MKRVIAFLLMGGALLAGPKMLRLDDLIALALRHSPDLQAYRADLNASLARIETARSAALPRVDLTAGAGGVGVDGVSTEGVETSSLLSGTIRVSQLLYDFGKTRGTVASQKRRSEAYEADLRQKIADKIYEVKEAYYRLLQSHHLIAVAEEDVRLNERQLYRARRYYEAGIRTKIDVTDAKVNLIRAQKRLNDTRYEYRRAGYYMAKVIGVDMDAEGYDILTPTADADATEKAMPAESLREFEAFAYRHRMAIETCRKGVESEKARLGALEGEYWPGLYIEAGYGVNEVGEERLESLFAERQADAMLTLRWNLYRGGATDAKVQEQRARVISAAARCGETKLRVRQEVADAYTRVRKAYAAVRLAQSLAEAAKEKFDQARKRYEHGLADFIELQQARQGHIDAEAGLVIDIYAFFTTLAELERATGR